MRRLDVCMGGAEDIEMTIQSLHSLGWENKMLKLVFALIVFQL